MIRALYDIALIILNTHLKVLCDKRQATVAYYMEERDREGSGGVGRGRRGMEGAG